MSQKTRKTASFGVLVAGGVLGVLAEVLLPTYATVTVVAIVLAVSVSIPAALAWLDYADAVAGVMFTAVVIAAVAIIAGFAVLAISMLVATMVAVNAPLNAHYAGR